MNYVLTKYYCRQLNKRDMLLGADRDSGVNIILLKGGYRKLFNRTQVSLGAKKLVNQLICE